MEAVSGNQRYDVFGYDDHDTNGNYDNISGFTYAGDFSEGTEQKTARATFDLTGFSGILEYYDQIADSVVITAKSNKSELERSTTITRVIDGRVGRGISSVNKSGSTVSVTYDDNSIDDFTVNGISSVTSSGSTLTIAYDDGTSSEIEDGNGISSIIKSGTTVTVTYDDGTTNTFTVQDAIQADPDYVTVSSILKKSDGSYEANHLDLDFTFRQDGNILAKRRYRASRSGNSWSTTLTNRDGDISDEKNTSQLSASISVDNSSAQISVNYSNAGGTVLSTGTASVFLVSDGRGISSVNKSGSTVSVTYDDNSIDDFTVNGISSVTSSGSTLTIAYDDGTSSEIEDGNGISSIIKSGTTVTVTYDDGTTNTFTVEDGKNASTPTFRGIWNDQTNYIAIQGSTTEADRGDIVQFTGYGSILPPDNKYYIAKSSSGPGNIQPPYDNGLNSTYWLEFGDEFENVATDLLLTKEAIITEKLTMGVGGSATEVPHSGIIVSADFTGGLLNVFPPENEPYQIIDNTNYFENYDTPGFLLARTDDGVVFDVGGTGIIGQTGYIRFSNKIGKLEIAGSFMNNTVLDNNAFLVDGSFDSFVGLDNFTSFIGGGYNNELVTNNEDESFKFYENLGSAILGGAWNQMNSRFSAIAGGYSGYCADNFSFIGGGYRNTMPLEEPGDHQGANFIGCGIDNQINGGASQTIVNGVRNTIEGLTGNYIPVFDRDNGLFSKRILGRYEGGILTYENIAFHENDYGWTSTESGVWFPAGIDLHYHEIADSNSINDYYTNGFNKSLYIGEVDSLVSDSWVYHADFKWMYVRFNFESKLYSNETLDYVYAYFAEGNANTAGWYRFSRVGAQTDYIKTEYGNNFSLSRFFKMENSVLKYSDNNPPTNWSSAF